LKGGRKGGREGGREGTYLLDAVELSDVVEGVDGGGQAAVEAEDLKDEGGREGGREGEVLTLVFVEEEEGV